MIGLRDPFFEARGALYTNGAQPVAEAGGAYWSLDEIAHAQRRRKRVAGEEFPLRTLKVEDARTAKLTCDGGADNVVYTKRVAFTDFPPEEIKLYCVNKTIMAPSEY